MKKHAYNDSINAYEIDPRYLEEGIHAAEEKGFDSIRIRGFVNDCDFKCQLDLTPLENKMFIKKLLINDSFKLKGKINIDALYSLVKMTELSVALPISINFSHLKQLQKLGLHKNNNYENLEELINLKELYISRYTKENCSEIGHLKELTFLRLDCSNSLVSLDGTENLEKLQTFWLAKNPLLSEAKSISKLNNLEWLYAEGCKKLMDYSFLNDNDSIKKLLISDLDSLDFVRKMKRLENINFWNCKSGDLSPLLECQTLKEVSFHPQKKYYSHKRDEINNVLLNKNKK